MEYDFKRAIRIEKKTFAKGVNEVPPEVEAHPHFAQYVEAGLIGEPEKPKLRNGDSFAARNKKLADKMKAEKAAKAGKPSEPVREPVQPPVDPAEPSKGDEPLTPPPADPTAPVQAELTPAQKAAQTRKANAEAKKAEEK